MRGQRRVDAVGDDRVLEGVQVVVGHEMVGEAQRDRVGAVELGAGQRGVMTEQSGRARQDERAADVGDEADTHFGHRHFGGVGDDADAAVGADPDTAAHHDAVHQRDIGLAEATDLRVEQILVVPELSRLGPVGTRTVIDHHDVAAGAEAALTGAGHHHRADAVVALPVREHRRHRR